MRSSSCATSRTSRRFVVTHQIRDAFYIAEHRAERQRRKIEVVKADSSEVPGVEFMVLHEGTIKFQGSACELLAPRRIPT